MSRASKCSSVSFSLSLQLWCLQKVLLCTHPLVENVRLWQAEFEQKDDMLRMSISAVYASIFEKVMWIQVQSMLLQILEVNH